MILKLFCDLLRTKSRERLAHYAMVQTLAFWFKGTAMPRLKFVGSAMTANIKTAWIRLEAMHKEGVLTFNEKLMWLAYAHGAFDNFNRLISAKYHREGKSSNNQIGTAALVREDTSYLLPQGTTMASPCGIPFEVVWCEQHTPTQMLVVGRVAPDIAQQFFGDYPCDDETITQEYERIKEGFLYPEIGWDVVDAPGMTKMPPMTYQNQEIPPPMNAWVESGSSDAKLLFAEPRPFCYRNNSDCESFSSDRVFESASQPDPRCCQ